MVNALVLCSNPYIKDSVRRFVLLKLTTDRYEASRGLCATAELLVELTVDTRQTDRQDVRNAASQ